MYLNTHSAYSLRFGIMTPEKLLQEASARGVHSFVLSDINNTSGWFEILADAKKFNIDVKCGIEFKNGNTTLFIGIAKNVHGFAEMNRYLSGFLKLKLPIPPLAPEFEHVYIIYPYQSGIIFTLVLLPALSNPNKITCSSFGFKSLLPSFIFKNNRVRIIV